MWHTQITQYLNKTFDLALNLCFFVQSFMHGEKSLHHLMRRQMGALCVHSSALCISEPSSKGVVMPWRSRINLALPCYPVSRSPHTRGSRRCTPCQRRPPRNLKKKPLHCSWELFKDFITSYPERDDIHHIRNKILLHLFRNAIPLHLIRKEISLLCTGTRFHGIFLEWDFRCILFKTRFHCISSGKWCCCKNLIDRGMKK